MCDLGDHNGNDNNHDLVSLMVLHVGFKIHGSVGYDTHIYADHVSI
jgi:hypothetical protein